VTPTPKEIHEQEQLISGLRHLAMILHAFYHVLCEEGFSSEQAMELTTHYQVYLCETDPDED
jgi:hypothetical protein